MKRLQELIDDLHDPNAVKDHSVYILFSDGELVYTKAGDIFLQRTFHMFESPIVDPASLDLVWPRKVCGYPCITFSPDVDKERITEIRGMMKALVN